MKYISLLGATGSIGLQTLDVIREKPEQFKLLAISAGKNIELVRKIINEFSPELVSVQLKGDCEKLKTEYPSGIKFTYGTDGLSEVAVHEKSNILLNAVMGSVGLHPTLQAIKAKKTIALANKETLVTAGHIVMAAAKENNVSILPVDSEHSAIFQCLQGEQHKNVNRLIVTASGGSFRDLTREELRFVTVDQALNHPNWSMGSKITIDSATMMNKGLEVIEAHWLFNLPYEKIDVLLHRESIIHSMVEYHDSSVIAQLGSPDMRVPIQYALSYPDRLYYETESLNLAKIRKLHFEDMDFQRFRCLQFAYEAGKVGGTMPTVLNAANEAAVSAFLLGEISFLDIEELIEKALVRHNNIENPDLDAIQEVDIETRKYVNSLF
ncbi:1-deoxy-D-xylulose-5-phosphate reductoisomerase [Lederbergia citrea]|uniref:1-deoxy-D-xylulose 5-phosphate reductoisomerase n=1 Tax=Lederbergia citrea TaxID=2833581 RepID=A0A942UMV7_9BACI|nr:1-deoxy-D-xylulose-5-phosphate reductoisomerase [Lederbergia citrea]MBS4177089.1 1-deoxy-D-xylulose-5-phosphate reductoisomerase [Lederbergia citrea]MBS4203752.1 1-deoxy-D-xylulose-5-phosphate reductoisomerase [Lederbergia citrea]MBS4221663.1 1-deoxy-D-xylulose-5-phosphate reductoisomerase [Lederbergia citrea]